MTRYEPAGVHAAEARFLSEFPDFDPDGTFAALRREEYGRLDDEDQVYLDYTGGGLHAASQIEAHFELLRTPRARQPPLQQPDVAGDDGARAAAPARPSCDYFNAPPDDYLCIFTANASAALRLVGEAYRFDAGGTFALTFDNHNSVNGIREFARRGARRSPTCPSWRPICASTERR